MPRLPASSGQFGTALTPDATLRQCVLFCGYAAVAGIPILLAMPLSWLLKVPLALAWLFECRRELLNFRQGTARLHELRLDAAGKVTVIGPDGSIGPATLLSGSMVLQRLAWLRVRFADGRKHGELFRPRSRLDADWHRLQLLWRHRRGAFGRQEGS